jgi:hypothetical protein
MNKMDEIYNQIRLQMLQAACSHPILSGLVDGSFLGGLWREFVVLSKARYMIHMIR